MQKTQLLEQELSHEKVFEESYSWLLQWALRLTEGKHSEAEDLVHDLFIQLIRLRPTLHSDPDHVRGYLYTMLRNMHLSKLRRAQRSPICELSVVDYDSVEQGLRSVPHRPLSEVWTELLQICHYACERKKTSRSASVLILRFFLAYFPSEIARILKTTRAPVDKYLHIARKEAQLRIAKPAKLRIFGQSNPNRESLPVPEEPQECFLALRREVFQSCKGRCFSKDELQRIYSSSSSKSLSTLDLAHLVSCSKCLDTVNSILGIRSLADRCPSQTLSRDDGPPTTDGGSGGGGGTSSSDGMREALRRFDEENEHHPRYLQVAINGDIKASQKITSELSELHLKAGRNRTFEFLEIFSEQDIRLLYMPISSSCESTHCIELACIELSDGRTLEVSVSFSGDSPTVHVKYYDPLFTELAAMDEPAPFGFFQSDSNEHTLAGSGTLWGSFVEQWNRCTSTWPRGVMATVMSTVLVVVAALMWRHHPNPFLLPTDLLQKATLHAASEIAPNDLVKRTIRVQQLGASRQTVHEDSVEEWSSGDGKTRVRRLYDPKGALVAEEITRGNHSTFYGQTKHSQIAELNPAHLQAQDVWQITPSAHQFQELIAPDRPSAIKQDDDHYSIIYQPYANIGSGLVEATLVLRRKDLHPLEEDLVVRTDGEVHHVHLIEASYERVEPSNVYKDVFAPDKTLFEIETQGIHRELPGTSTATPIGANIEKLVHASYLLSRIGADMNGETNLQVAGRGTITITGTVATAARRNEILRSLDPLIARGDVEVRLLVADQLHPNSKEGHDRQVVEVIEPTSGTIPLDRQLRQFLADHGTQPDHMEGAIQRYSRQVLMHADETQQHAWSLDRIIKRFTPAELNSLSPSVRLEWIQVIDLHSASLLRCVQETRSELASFAPSGQQDNVSVDAITNINELANTADELLNLARSNNRTLGNAFALSAAPEESNALNSQEFWQSLARLEALARQMADTEGALRSEAILASR